MTKQYIQSCRHESPLISALLQGCAKCDLSTWEFIFADRILVTPFDYCDETSSELIWTETLFRELKRTFKEIKGRFPETVFNPFPAYTYLLTGEKQEGWAFVSRTGIFSFFVSVVIVDKCIVEIAFSNKCIVPSKKRKKRGYHIRLHFYLDDKVSYVPTYKNYHEEKVCTYAVDVFFNEVKSKSILSADFYIPFYYRYKYLQLYYSKGSGPYTYKRKITECLHYVGYLVEPAEENQIAKTALSEFYSAEIADEIFIKNWMYKWASLFACHYSDFEQELDYKNNTVTYWKVPCALDDVKYFFEMMSLIYKYEHYEPANEEKEKFYRNYEGPKPSNFWWSED